MMIGRALLAIVIVSMTIPNAGAQFGGMPGMPGSGPPAGGGGGFGAPRPSGPPPQCQELLTLRDELQKHGAAIGAANDKKSDVKVACRLFRVYIATEAKMLKALETHGSACGVPKEIHQQVRGSHAKAQQIGKQVCDAAARGPAPSGPTLSDALGTSPTLPKAGQKGAGTFETLTGSPFQR
jgi:hypothetical protein